jgi:hypothetical protein
LAAPNRNMPLKSYALSRDLIEGLATLSAREDVAVNAIVRRAIRRELEKEGVLAAAENPFDRHDSDHLPTTLDPGEIQAF